MKPLLNRVRIGDIVQGKMTKKLYKVWLINTEAQGCEDAVVLIDTTNTRNQVEYTRLQFNRHFKLMK